MTTPTGEHILVPLDGSKNAENAIPFAGIMARVFDSDIVFLQAQAAAAEPSAGDRFDEYAMGRAAHFGLPRGRSSTRLLSGAPAAAILDAAAEPGTRAIVLASHGRGGFRAALFGSVADRVIRGTAWPVLVVPGVGGPPVELKQVLVTLDGSPLSEQALIPARLIAQAVGAELSLVEACSPTAPLTEDYLYYAPAFMAELRATAQKYLGGLANTGEHTLAVQGDPAAAIVRLAAELDADLVVMASHGKDLSRRFFLGSTTDRVMHELHRPLLIIPPLKD